MSKNRFARNAEAKEAEKTPPSLSFLYAEKSFLEGTGRGKPKSNVRAINAVTRQSTVEYFRSILSDEIERQLWMMFMTGQVPEIGPDGQPVVGENGQLKMVPIELNPISFNAFKRAVEYKRGMPQVTIVDERKSEDEKIVEITIIGANKQFFEEAANVKGLIAGGTK